MINTLRRVLFLLSFSLAFLLLSKWSAPGRLAYGQACPTVSGINPTSGNIGSTITISGTNFTGVNSVRFFNNVIANFTINSATQITATVPATAASGPITLFKDSCSNVQTASFTVIVACPTVTNLNPTSGAVGSSVTISGTNFAGVTSVRFFNNVIANFTINSDTQITATVPATAVTGPITLTKDNCSNVQTASFTIGSGGNCLLKADYQFQNTRSSSTGSPPALTDLPGSPANTFVTDTVDGSPRTVLDFPVGNGLALQPTTGVIANNVYTVVILFKFADVSGFRRILDFKTPASDLGLYNQSGNLIFFSGGSGSGTPLNDTSYAQVVLTRDAAKNVTGYVNGTQHFTFVDSSDQSLIDGSNRLSFFKDNGGEQAAGKVARIRLYDCVLSASEVAALDRLPSGTCPLVTNLNPTSGAVGSSVIITGSNFTGVTAVKFSNNVNATITGNTGTQLTVTVPSGALTGPITISKTGCADVQTATFTIGTGGSCAVKADYQFQNTRSSSIGSPPALTDLIHSGNPVNSFTTDTVDGSPRTVLSFPEENGLALQPTTGVIANNVYTIVMLFKLGRVTGYQRLLDFRTPANNSGLYNLDGNLTFYNLGVFGSGAPLNNTSYAQVVLTRDAAKNVTAYVNGTQHFSFVDSGDFAVIDASNRLSFFKDDGLEGVDGKVARIRLYDCALSASEVAALDRLPTGGGGNCPTVSGINPTSGAVGSSVTINGTNFTGVTAVKFSNNVAATSFNVVNATTITAVVPSGAVTGPIIVSKTGCADVQTATFTVTQPAACPTVTNLNPTSGAVGSTVTITGTNLTGVSVSFAGCVPATPSNNTGTQLTVTVPGGAMTGPITLSKAGCAAVQTPTFNVSINPGEIAQQAYLKASNTDANDQFGWSAALSGDTLVVGARFEDSNATGVNGDQNNNNADGAGAVYVFVRNGTTWSQQAYLKASNASEGDNFGFSVAISGDTIVVGARGEDSNATGVNGNQNDNTALDSGAAYVFVRSGTLWSQQAYLKASNTDVADWFGWSVAISGNTVVVGAFNEDSNATGVNGDQSNNSAEFAGATYVFVRNGTSWSQQAYLKASNTAASDRFGDKVAVSGDTIVVGAFNEDSNATGVNGDQTNNSADAAGAAYVFVRSGTTWSQQAYLKASNSEAGDAFGGSVTISGETLVVGASGEDSSATGINGSQSNNSAPDSGAAYVFVRNAGVWSQQAYLKASNSEAGDGFGSPVAISGDTIVGASGDDSNTTGVNGDQSNNSAMNAGAAYVFVRNVGLWSQQAYLKASNTEASDGFGQFVGVSGDTAVVAAIGEDSNATGINGNQCDNSASLSGAAYVFTGLGTSPPCPTITINPANPTLPTGTAAQPYSQSFTATGGGASYSFLISAGALPTGLNLSANGMLSGTPTGSGIFNFSVQATDANNCTGNRQYTLTINASGCPTITLNPATLPAGTQGVTYSQALSASGGATPYLFALAGSSSLPAGLTLSANGTLSGTPTSAGNSTFTIIAVDANNCAGNRSYTVTINNPNCPAITINPVNPTLLPGTAGQSYNQSFTANGGTASHSFTVSAGALPTGLNLAANGTLFGTPTVFGNFNFTVRATDANNCFGERSYTLAISSPCGTLTVNPTTLPVGTVGMAYNQTFSATGGTGAITWSVSTGALPNGLTLNAASGVLTGTPTVSNTFNFTIKATDANNCMGTRIYTVIISGAGLMFYPLPAPVRLLDTRPGTSPNACSQPNVPIAGQTSRTQLGRNICTIPANAQALTGNVTTVDSGGGFLTLYPSDATQPTVANTNYGVNEVINNVFTVGLGADGTFKIFAHTTTDVVVDVTGYYAPPGAGGLYFHPLPAPVRLLETRPGLPVGCVKPGVPLTGMADSTQQIVSACTGIPAAARSIVGNATTVDPQGAGFLTLFPGDATRPLVASSNYNFGQVVNGPFSVGLAQNGEFKIYTHFTTHLVVDVLGYYSPEANDANGAGLLFTPLPKPVRLLETRPSLPVGCFKPGVPLAGGSETLQTARGLCDGVTIPSNALGVVGNATVVFPSSLGFLTLWPSTAARPLVATSNYNAGDVRNRHFIVGLGQVDGAFKVYTQATTHLVIDLSGYFAP